MTNLDRLEELLAKATKGQWYVDPENTVCAQVSGEHHAVCTDQFCYAPQLERNTNATLIVEAINALPTLIADLRAKDERIRELEGALCNARAQLKYLDDRFPTGSSAGVIGQIEAALANGEQ